jgi:uncharacterized membrane protein YhaH (DUF805 family)
MTGTYDPQDDGGVAKSTSSFWWLKGRAGRREYWASMGCVFAAGLAAEYFPARAPVQMGLGVVLMLLQIRRLHDFNRSGWWAVAAAFAPVVLVVAFMTSYFIAARLGGLVIALLFVMGVGAWPGDRGDNRFGPSPPFTAQRVFTGR